MGAGADSARRLCAFVRRSRAQTRRGRRRARDHRFQIRAVAHGRFGGGAGRELCVGVFDLRAARRFGDCLDQAAYRRGRAAIARRRRRGFARRRDCARQWARNAALARGFAALVDAAAARAPTEFDLRREGRTVAAAVAADAIDLRAAANDPLRALGIAPESFATAEIAFVVADGAAERAGIQTGDEIVSIDGEVVDSWPQVVRLIEGAPLTEIEIVVWRDGAARAFAATPDGGERDGREIGVLGVAPTRDMAALAAARVTVRLGPIESALAAGPQTGRAILRSFRFLFHFVAGRLGAENIYGPIGIAQQSGDSARAGLAPFLGFIALLSVALGAVNLLPIPALDGGRLLLHALEILLRRPLPPAVVSWAEIGGVAAVVALMAFAVAGDIMRLLP